MSPYQLALRTPGISPLQGELTETDSAEAELAQHCALAAAALTAADARAP